MIRPMFICTAAVSVSTRMSAEHMQNPPSICAASSSRQSAEELWESGSRRVQLTPLPFHALFVAEVLWPLAATAEPPCSTHWVPVTAHNLFLTLSECSMEKTSVFSIWGRWFLMTFNDFYLRSKSTPTAIPPHFVRAVCTVSSADGSPAVPPFRVAPGTSHAWQTQGDIFFTVSSLLSRQNRCAALLITGFSWVHKHSRSRVILTGFLPWKNAEVHCNSS